MAVASKRLAAGVPAAGVGTSLLTVGPGFSAIVKSVFVYNATAGAANVQAMIWDPINSIACMLIKQNVAAGGRAEWEGWAVGEFGHQLFVLSDVGNIQFWFSGAYLVNI